MVKLAQQRLWLVGLLLTALACTATPSSSPAVVAGTPPPAPAYTGQFDCYGAEKGLGAYAGRVTLQPGGLVTFKDYDGLVQTGAWTYDAPGRTFTFTGASLLASAVYNPAQDSLVVVFTPNASVIHTDNAGMRCQRAVPGQTGPP